MTFPDYSQLGTQHAQPGSTFRLGADAELAGRGIPFRVVFSTGAQARLSQEPFEVLGQGTPSGRITSFGLEVIEKANTLGRITQMPLEAAIHAIATARVTQMPIEVAVSATRRAIPFKAVISKLTTHHDRTIPFTVHWKRTLGRIIQFKVGFGGRTIHMRASFRRVLDRPIPIRAEIGYTRHIPMFAAILGHPARVFPFFARLIPAGHIPMAASFWGPVPTFNITSDVLTTVMSLNSLVLGRQGPLGSYLGFPTSNYGQWPVGWEAPGYDDSLWLGGLNRVLRPTGFGDGFPVPFPNGFPGELQLNFNWQWPNVTQDYSNGGVGVQDPFNDIVLLRRVFGLPLDPRVALATTGVLQAGASGIFDVAILTISINGLPIEFQGLIGHAGGGVGVVFNVPNTTFLPGENVISMSFTSYLAEGFNSRGGDFLLTLTYHPETSGGAQVIG